MQTCTDPVTDQPETNKQRFVSTLREIADYVESRPFDANGHYFHVLGSFFLACKNAEQFGKNVAAAGTVEKTSDDNNLRAVVKFGDEQFVILVPKDETCQRVKVGERVIPAKEEYTTPATEKRVEEVFEWKCPKSFLALKDEPAREDVPA